MISDFFSFFFKLRIFFSNGVTYRLVVGEVGVGGGGGAGVFLALCCLVVEALDLVVVGRGREEGCCGASLVVVGDFFRLLLLVFVC